MADNTRVIATYARVSTDEQRERQTILNQREALSRRLSGEPKVRIFKNYVDDGVSGTVPLEDRPAGADLVRAANAGRFSELWVVRTDRLGRDALELLRIWNLFESLGIRLHATHDNIEDPLSYDIQAVMAAHERRRFLERSAEGMNRAARDGRYTGGIVPLGYTVQGTRASRRLVPDNSNMWGDLSAADVVRRIYHHLAVDRWSCRRIAEEFNSLGIPTAYRRAGRGVRGKQTQGIWRPSRIRNLVVNPVYRGVVQYGLRSTNPRGREVISARGPRLVSDDIWYAAIENLKRHRIMPKNSRRQYLLRSVIRCGVCGLTFCGTSSKDLRYRCNGTMRERGPVPGRCPSASIKGEPLEAAVWSDITRFLLDPGDLVDELLDDTRDIGASAVIEAERITLSGARTAAEDRRKRALDLYTRGKISEEDFDDIARAVKTEVDSLNERLTALAPPDYDPSSVVASEDLIEKIRERLNGGLTESERQEIVQQLVHQITIHTTVPEHGRKQVRIVIDYRFPCVAETRTVMDSLPRLA